MEGYADCIMAHQFGITNAVATLGTALTDNHVSALRRFTRKVILVFDGDKAGKEAAEKSLPRFLSQEVDLRILTLTSEKDPADFLIAPRGGDLSKSCSRRPRKRGNTSYACASSESGSTRSTGASRSSAEMLELFRQAPGFGGSARENIVLNRLAFRVGLSESQIREMLVARPAQGRTQRGFGACAKARAAGRGRSCRHRRQIGERRVRDREPTIRNWNASCSRLCCRIRRPSTFCGPRWPSTTSSTNTTVGCWGSVIAFPRRGSSLRMKK